MALMKRLKHFTGNVIVSIATVSAGRLLGIITAPSKNLLCVNSNGAGIYIFKDRDKTIICYYKTWLL